MIRSVSYLKNKIQGADPKKLRRVVLSHAMQVYLPVFLCFIKWIFFSLGTGVIVGLAGTAFHYSVVGATAFRKTHPYMLFLLPVAGLAIAGIYYISGLERDSGTNKILSAVRESARLTPKRMICIFAGSVLTHLTGGSSGREGAALQIGSSIGGFLGKNLRLDEDDLRIMIMCGMSAGFSSVFGTPVAAAIFSIEVISVGILHYSAIVPCMISSVTGYFVASLLGVTYFELDAGAPAVEAAVVLKTIGFAALCGILSWLACFCLEKTADIMQKLFRNEFYRAAAGGCAVVLLTLLVRTDMYNGIGADVIYSAFESRMLWYVFLLKLIFTALTLGSGFKGGEIVPIFFIGSCFGSSLSGLFDVPPSFFAAMGMIALFCGVTNCPVSSILIGIELFGSENIVYCGIACAVSYMLSGYRGLYHEQRIAYSKLKTKYINKQVE